LTTFNFCQKWLTGIGIYLVILGKASDPKPSSRLKTFMTKLKPELEKSETPTLKTDLIVL
jgi:hypothetical protein